MESYKLPVYNRARMLVRQMYASTQKMPRDIRIEYVTPMVVCIMSIMEYISFANEADTPKQRAEFIDKAICDLHRIQIRTRILFDCEMGFRQKGYDAVIAEEANLSRQLAGWKKKTLNA